jgi:ArsR family transcriptional regulator, arsenate/arsenite/antimonite-responsive transcriptional repressor
MADVFQALSSSVRRDILAMLKDKDMTAGDISERLDVSKSTLSGHFNVLKAADLVVSERSGTTITYSLNTSVVEDLMGAVMHMLGKDETNNNNKGEKK